MDNAFGGGSAGEIPGLLQERLSKDRQFPLQIVIFGEGGGFGVDLKKARVKFDWNRHAAG